MASPGMHVVPATDEGVRDHHRMFFEVCGGDSHAGKEKKEL